MQVFGRIVRKGRRRLSAVRLDFAVGEVPVCRCFMLSDFLGLGVIAVPEHPDSGFDEIVLSIATDG